MGCGSSTDAQTDTGKNKESQHGPAVQGKNKKHQRGHSTQGKDKETQHQRGHSTQGKDKENQHEERETMYLHVDEHAKQAPYSLRNSVADLVKYLSIPSTQPQMLVRAFFVWISENIRYDTDGYFGKSTKAPCDEESVMRNGKSVCEGYANVMQVLCRQANINVKKLSGHAKGYGHSADNPITTSTAPNHAWNAVEINGKWFLLDSTWGAGHLDSSKQFKKEFNEFYFMTDPKQIVTTHFPYIEGNMEVSKKWQLLDKPIGLVEFNKMLLIHPHAFKLGVQPLSHLDGVVEMKNEVELKFTIAKNQHIKFSANLMYKEGNRWIEKQRKTYGKVEGNVYKLRVHPHIQGTFRLNIFGKKESDAELLPELFEYIIKCSGVKDADFEYLQVEKVADDLGVKAISHPCALIKVENEVELTFESKGVLFTDRLFVKEENTLIEKQNSTYGKMEDGLYKLRVHPHRTGTFHLQMFAKNESEPESYSFLFEYILKCSRADNSDFEFPGTYPQTQIDKCLLLEPLPNKIQGNRDVNFRLSSPFLQRIMINQTFLHKSGTTFAGIVKAGQPGTTLTIYGSRQQDGSLDDLFQFKLI